MTYIKAHHGSVRFFRGAPQFIDLKQLADLESVFKKRCRQAIRHYQACRHALREIDDPLEKHYRDLEASLARKRAEDAARLYRLIQKDNRRRFRDYIASVTHKKFSYISK